MHNPITRELIHSLHTAIDTIATKYSIADTIDIDLTPTMRELEIIADTLFKQVMVKPAPIKIKFTRPFVVEFDLNGKRDSRRVFASDIDHLLEQLPADAALRKITPLVKID